MDKVESQVIKINDNPPTLKELQKMVGGYIEIVHLANGDQMIIDEEGKLKEKPVNMEATELWLGDVPADFIVGTAVVLSGKAKID